PDCLPALRALRHLALDAGDLQTAVEVLAQEARCAPELERAPLAAVRAELLLALGAVEAAAEAWSGLRSGPVDTWARAGLVDAAVGGAGDLRAALGALAAHVTDPALAGALSAERGSPEGGATRSLAGAVAQLAVVLRERDAAHGARRAEAESTALE